jgi:release factor glutamine methyltransferase
MAGIDSPRLEARLLLAHSLGLTPAELLRDLAAPVLTDAFAGLLARREAHEPLALILGHREFWSLDLAVSPATLVPRPDSETLIEAALAAFASRAQPRCVLDLGTGTGCLLLAALSEFPHSFGIGVDRSAAAAAIAAQNAATLGLADRSAFLCGDWGAALGARFELILCNPPYIPSPDLAGLMPDVAKYEPEVALDGGPDGYSAYRAVVPDLARLLTRTGVAVLELGAGQAETVAELAREAGFAATLRQDLLGIDRALVLQSALP